MTEDELYRLRARAGEAFDHLRDRLDLHGEDLERLAMLEQILVRWHVLAVELVAAR